jgi:excisionase family DNA binding protein
MRDEDLGVARVRAFGTYDFRITSPTRFLREVAGSDHDFTLDEFNDTMRSRVVSIFSDALAVAKVPLFELAGRYGELGEALAPVVSTITMAKYGLEITSFVIENVSVPPEVEQAIDKRSAMAAIGNLNDYVKFQVAQGMGKGGGPASSAAELAMGMSVAQELIRQQGMPGVPTQGGAPDLLSPADVARHLGVPESDVMAVIESGELSAKRIGTSYRVTRANLDAYLAR